MVRKKDVLVAEGFGNLMIESTLNDVDDLFQLRDVMYAPNMIYSLIRCSKGGHSELKTDINYSDDHQSKAVRQLMER